MTAVLGVLYRLGEHGVQSPVKRNGFGRTLA